MVMRPEVDWDLCGLQYLGLRDSLPALHLARLDARANTPEKSNSVTAFSPRGLAGKNGPANAAAL